MPGEHSGPAGGGQGSNADRPTSGDPEMQIIENGAPKHHPKPKPKPKPDYGGLNHVPNANDPFHNGGHSKYYGHGGGGGGGGVPHGGTAGGDLMSLIHEAGFRGNAASTMYAIVMAESSGNADAHNTNAATGDNSYGLTQINMLGSLGPERMQEFGLTSANQLFDPLTNLKVAYRLSNGGRDFSPWSTYNTGAYQQYLGQTGARVVSNGATYGSTGSGGGVGTASANLSRADYQQALGDMAGLLNAVPGLRDILNKAISQGWSLSTFQQQVEQSDWYRNHSDAVKRLISLKYQDPAQYQTEYAAGERAVQQEAQQLGVSLTSQELHDLTWNSLAQGWDSTTLRERVGSRLDKGDPLQGQYATYYGQLKQMYSQYGVPVGEQALDQQARSAVMSGGANMDALHEHAIQTAKSLYPGIAHNLDAGMTVQSIADPFVQTMGKLLEIDPNQIGIDNPLIKRALQGQTYTQNGKTTTQVTSLSDFENQVRADPRWQKTQNAYDTTASALVTIGRDWGFGV